MSRTVAPPESDPPVPPALPPLPLQPPPAGKRPRGGVRVGGVQWGRAAVAGAAAGVLWLAVGGLAQALRWFANFGNLLEPVLPATMRGNLWMWPAVWGYGAVLLGALAVAAVTVAILALPAFKARPRGGAVAAGRGATWLAVIIAATVVGIAADLARFAGFGPIPGIGGGLRGQLSISDLGASAAAGAYWGVLYGWIAALLGPRRMSGAAAGFDPDQETQQHPHPPQKRGKRAVAGAVLAVVLAAALVAGYTVVSTMGAREHSKAQQIEAQAAEDAAAAEAGIPRTGAAPDPDATGERVPERAARSADRKPEWCAPEALTLMLPRPDAATGHRMMTLSAVNVTDAPCVVEGYPDFAFADQNGHLLPVTIEPGGSFMAQDPGVSAITLQPGESAVSYLGWNANSTHGELVAAEVYAAPFPGDLRGSWPQQPAIDIIEGSTVAVTAWAFRPLPLPED